MLRRLLIHHICSKNHYVPTTIQNAYKWLINDRFPIHVLSFLSARLTPPAPASSRQASPNSIFSCSTPEPPEPGPKIIYNTPGDCQLLAHQRCHAKKPQAQPRYHWAWEDPTSTNYIQQPGSADGSFGWPPLYGTCSMSLDAPWPVTQIGFHQLLMMLGSLMNCLDYD